MSYLNYFGFDSEPFGHAPSSRFYYASTEHSQALRRLLHCVHSMQGLAVLVGDIGRGKTTLARRLLEALPEAEYVAALVVLVHKDIAPLWLIKHIAVQLGVQQPESTASELIGQLYAQLIVLQQAGRRAVVLIDEAQMLQTQALMEEFRGLLNLEVPGAKLISFVFFGLPSLEESLRLDPPLAQRVAMRYALQPLNAQACTEYIEHRLQVVGARWQIFSPSALQAIFHYSQGVPRVVNTLCDNLLLETFFAGAQLVEAEHVAAVANNLRLSPATQRSAAPVPVAVPATGDVAGLTGEQLRPAKLGEGSLQNAAQPSAFGHDAPEMPSAVAAVEDWSGLTAVGSLLSNQLSASTSFAAAEEVPTESSDAAAVASAPQAELAATAYGTLNLDEVTALLAQLNRI